MTEESGGESQRQRSQRLKREAGNRSGRLARTLMQLTDAAVERLDIDDELREAVNRARSVSSNVARRREERRLAGVLRTGDLGALEAELSSHEASGRADARLFKLAEAWRARLIDEGPPALEALQAELAGLAHERWTKLIEDAQAERVRGKPKGAATALFREVMSALRARERETNK